MDRATDNENRLKAARTERRWSQHRLASKADVPQARISRLEQGKPPAAVLNAIKVARALDTTVEALFGESAGADEGTGVHDINRERLEPRVANG